MSTAASSRPFQIAPGTLRSVRNRLYLSGLTGVLLVGARLNWLLGHGESPQWSSDSRFIQVDIAPAEFDSNQPIEAPLVGDIESVMSALRDGLATRDMYAKGAETDGLIDLWFNDGTHASVHGSYLSALTLFGSITGLDPQSLGRHEQAAFDLGISPDDAWALQRVAALELGFAAAVPEPGQAALLAAGLLGLAGWRRARGRQGR